MSETTTITEPEPWDDDAVLDWLEAQPGGSTQLRPAELGRLVGWSRQKVSRRLTAWVKDGQIVRRGRVITYNKARTRTRTIVKERVIREQVSAPDARTNAASETPDKSRTKRRTNGVSALAQAAVNATRTNATYLIGNEQKKLGQIQPDLPPAEPDKSADGTPRIPPLTPHSDTTSETPKMGLLSMFSRTEKKAPEPLPDAPPEPEQTNEVPTGSVPAKTEERTPKPYVERPRWRLLGGTGRGVDRAGEGAVTVMPPRRWVAWSLPLWLLAYALLATSLGTGVWNAVSSTSTWWDASIPIAISTVSELMLFFLPGRIWTVGWPRKLLGLAMLTGFVMFALMNSMRLASNVSADQAMARADRQTAGVQTAAKQLADARAARATSCRRKEDKSKACTDARTDVAKLEKAQTQAATTVAATAKPENADFARVVAWITRGAIQPGVDDFQMLWIVLRTLIPQLGGLVLVMSRR
jgi:hypothetical protein